MLTVVTPASGTRLTTIPAARDHLLLGDDVDEMLIGDWIDQASDAIAQDCDRVFGRRVLRQAFGWNQCGEGLRFAERPAQIVSVAEGGVAVADTLYELDEQDGCLYRLDSAGNRFGWSASRTVVTFATGWVLPGQPGRNLPFSIEQACLTVVAARRPAQGRDPMLRSESTEGVGSASYIATADMAGIPPQASALLAPFRRWSVA